MDLELLVDKKEGRNYQADGFKILYRYKGMIAGDNDVNPDENIYMVDGKAKITLENKTWTAEAPHHFHFPAKTYHKVEALTDITLILFD